ncbi:hypothetical protein, partial [Stenotrophomonas indicatrix]|uniref:hypothetical protein n=1 Tax=Stenotrophomonas indicatrix TaxID=2045451 RepID=UPI001967D59E
QGMKAFTIQAGKSLTKGVPLGAVSRANKINAMVGEVESYDPVTGALVLDVSGARGVGEFTDWNLFVV